MTTRYLYGANVHANGIRQHYLRYGGRGKPIVIVPGITSPAITWGFVAEALSETFDVYILDVRGRGLSSSGAGLSYDLDTLAADLLAFVAELDLRHATVLGHSMGARVAVRAARGSADYARALVLVDPPVSGPGRRPYPSVLSWYLDSIRMAINGMSAQDMLTFCPTWSEEQRALRAEWLVTCDEVAVVTAFEGFHKDDIHKDLPHLRIPTSLMIASRGGVIAPEDVAEIQQLNPGIRMRYVPDAGHMIPWDNLSGFLDAFLALDAGGQTHV